MCGITPEKSGDISLAFASEVPILIRRRRVVRKNRYYPK
ncbi:hypothetical protein BLGI_2633 [Brevibacillus laterosporus GI-9]|nr:hypothetical protein BLGI_2633 [Brevibacillus laterosporus GI-9]